MAGTANNFRMTGRVLGPGILWGGLAVPSASSRLSLATVDADGFITPDATANPNAYALGGTKDGIVLTAKGTRTKFYIDEISGAVDSKLQQTEMSIKANLYGLMDSQISKLLTAGFGTYSTSTGYIQNTIGFATDTFSGFALIAPQREDPTKVLIFHIYKGINDSGLEFTVNKGSMSDSPVMIDGYAITTRTPSDQLGNFWWQI